MNKKIVSVLAAGLLCSQFLMPLTTFAAPKTPVRLGGSDRYATSIKITQAYWTTSNYAILARGDDFADALCAGPLATAYDAPILLTETGSLNSDVLAELKSLNVKNVFIAGGTGAVSDTVKNTLTKNNMTVTRLSGINRFETSSKIAEQVKAKLGTVSSVAVATGMCYADALSISSIAAKAGMPILLTEKSSLPDSVSNFIKDNSSITKSYVVGGTGVVNDTVKGLLPAATRLGGSDRYATNVAVMDQFKDKLDFNKTFIAVGDGATDSDGFPDALSGAPAAAKVSAPIALAYKTLDSKVSAFLSTKISNNSAITALGGSGVLPDTIVDAVVAHYAVPTISAASLNSGSTTVNATIDNNDNKIIFTLGDVKSFNGGNATINEDLAQVSIYKNGGLNSTKTNVKASDNFASIIFDEMKAAGYNPTDGILASNIQTLLNGASITLTDANGSTRTYMVVVQ